MRALRRPVSTRFVEVLRKMSSRNLYRQFLPQRRAEAKAGARLQTMQRGGKLYGVRRLALVDARAGDPGGAS